MLLIQAIRYLIVELEVHLKATLQATGISEKALADILKAASVDKKSDEAPVLETPEIIEKSVIEKLAALKLIDVGEDHAITKNEGGLKLALLSLPSPAILTDSASVLYQQILPTVDAQVDATQLHFGMTWGRLMTTSVKEFEGKLNTSLLKEELENNKMYILARFKRQLELLCAYSLKMLEEREKVWELSKETFDFGEKTIDEWLVVLVKECIAEAMHLSQKAMDNTKLKITKNVTYENTAGKTEAMLNICKDVVDEFYKFCAEINKAKAINTTMQCSMIDLLPTKRGKYQAIRLVNEKAAHDLVMRQFKLAHSKHYPKGTFEALINPINIFAFNPTVASDKCTDLAKALCAFEEIAKKHKEETAEYWDELFEQTHTACEDSKSHKPPMHSISPSIITPTQNSTMLWQMVHSGLHSIAPHTAQITKDKHQSCKL